MEVSWSGLITERGCMIIRLGGGIILTPKRRNLAL